MLFADSLLRFDIAAAAFKACFWGCISQSVAVEIPIVLLSLQQLV